MRHREIMPRHVSPPRIARHKAATPPRTPLSDALGALDNPQLRRVVARSAVVTGLVASATSLVGGGQQNESAPSITATFEPVVVDVAGTDPAAVSLAPPIVEAAVMDEVSERVLPTTPARTLLATDATSAPVSEVASVEVTPAPVPVEVAPEPVPVETVPVPPLAVDDVGAEIVRIAKQFRGTPYVWGGNDPGIGLDCSGFTQLVFRIAGISIPRHSGDQRLAGVLIHRDLAMPGDLFWWPGHVGIYLGDGQMIDSSRPGTVISVRDLPGRADIEFRRIR